MPQNAGNTTPTFQILLAFFISTPAFQCPVTYFRSISGHFNSAFLSVLCYLLNHASPHFITHFQQRREATTSTIFTLQAFLQIKYEWIHDPNQSPFSTHPIAMRVAVAASALHYLTYAASFYFPIHRLVLHLLVSSDYAAVAALSSIFLPDSAAPFVYAVFGLLSAAEWLLWMRRILIEEDDEAELWIRRWRVRRSLNNVYGDSGNHLGQRMRRLPV